MIENLKTTLTKVREAKPLVLCLTNTVTVEWVANSLLALGAAPIMSHDPREAEALTTIAGAVYLNQGTLDAAFLDHCKQAACIASTQQKPIVLDPVGAGASKIRTESAKALLPHASVVRGNASEIMALYGKQGKTLGVESTAGVHAAKSHARALAKEYACTVAISGKEDFVTGGSNEASLTWGSPLMPRITGMGCSLTAVIAAFHAVEPDPYEATRLAMAYFGLCGNIAQETATAPGSFKIAFLDALYEANVRKMETYNKAASTEHLSEAVLDEDSLGRGTSKRTPMTNIGAISERNDIRQTSDFAAVPKCLSIAGFDSSGGAGIQADLKTFSALGCYGMTVLTALPVQNTCGVKRCYDLPPSCVEEQLETIFEDIVPDAIKIGMLFSEDIIRVVATFLKKHAREIPLILDPVMVAKSGSPLLRPEAIDALKKQLIPQATVVTPNIPEAHALAGPIEDPESLGAELLKWGPQAVLLKGGHNQGPESNDLLMDCSGKITWLEAPRIPSENTHGTGCTLSAAICAYRARGYSLTEACKHAKTYLLGAIQASQRTSVGKGYGPVHHFHELWS